MHNDVMRLNILPHAIRRSWVPPTPAQWNLSKLNRKWYWRALDWFLKKLGGEYQDEIPASWPTRQILIDHRSIVALIETSASAMEALWDKRATTLVLGYNEMEKLMNEAPTELMCFNMPFPMAREETSRNRYDFDRSYTSRTVDLRIILVPWLSGWALLPDLDEK